MLSFVQETNRLNIRAVAVILHNDNLLIHKARHENFWSLPGGRVEFFEHSDATVIRELSEELGANATVIRPLWYVENFFHYEGQHFHEIASYFLTELVHFKNTQPLNIFDGIEDDQDLIYQWVPSNQLNQFTIKPEFLVERMHSLPAQLEFIKINEIETR